MTPVGSHFLDCRLLIHRLAFDVEVAFHLEHGETVALLGPNGAGKSTVLQALSGLIVAQDARIELAGNRLAGAGTAVPPHRRRIGLMGQDPLLFPHLTVLENVAFGPRSQGMPRATASKKAREWLQRLNLADLAGRRPGQLSGGQRQRAALARALAAEPDLLLLDEPLAAADVRTAGEIRQLLREHLTAAEQTTIVVTHEVLDAAVLADRVMVMSDGKIIDSGTTAGMLTEPGTEFGAALAGLNLILGTADGSGTAMRTDDGVEVTGIADEPLVFGAPAAAVFPPSAVAVYATPGVGSPRNLWAGRVLTVEAGPAAVRLRIAVSGSASDESAADRSATDATPTAEPTTVLAADVTPAAVAALPIFPGCRVHAEVKATQVRLYPRWGRGNGPSAGTGR
ncbi:MAG: ATP-binding cassette domain-containing protein [Actinomycetota bacterium]|nr:ATP-binding cassette domain-containing protein [Actinomycetota bacterium]